MSDHPIRALIVNTSAAVRWCLADMVAELEGVQVVGQAKNGLLGLELVRARRPNVIVLHVRSLGVEGLGLVYEIRRAAPLSLLIVATDSPNPTQCGHASWMGADCVFDMCTEVHRVVAAVGASFAGDSSLDRVYPSSRGSERQCVAIG